MVPRRARILRRIDSCITQLKAQGPSRTCNESKEEEEAPQDPPRVGAGLIILLPCTGPTTTSQKCDVVTEAGSYLRRIDFCITQLRAQGPSRTRNESKEEHLAERWVIYCQTTSVSAAHAVPRVGRSYEHFPDGFELHLLHKEGKHRERDPSDLRVGT